MQEPESRKYFRKVGCLWAPVWVPIYLTSAMLGILFGIIRRGFVEGNERVDYIASCIHMWDLDDKP